MTNDSKFQEKWVSEFKCVAKSKKGVHHVFCKLCSTDISIRRGGRNDLTRHILSSHHVSKAQAVADINDSELKMLSDAKRSGNRAKRKGRVDYKKLNQGDTDWKPDDEEEEREEKKTSKKEAQGKEPMSKSEPVRNCEIGTYLIMLYVTLEQERTLVEFFQENEWPFLKPDLSSLTEKLGPTLLTFKKSTDVKQMGNKKSTKQAKNVTKPLKEVKVERLEEDDNLESEDNERMDNTDAMLGSPRRKWARKSTGGSSTTSSTTTLTPAKTADEAEKNADIDKPKLDGTESVADTENCDAKTDEIEAKEDEENEMQEKNTDKEIGNEVDNKTGDTENKVEHRTEKMDDSTMVDGILNEGEVLEDQEPVMRCWECDQVLKDETDYTEHMLKQHSFDVKSGRYYCDQCDKHFKQPDYLKDHIKHIHEGKKRRPQKTTRDHVCEICGHGFKRSDQLKEHRSMVHFKKPLNTHECDICGKKFSRPRLLGYHMNKHTGNKPFQCTICGNSYYSRGGLYVHARMCQRVNPLIYECDTCNKRFANPYARKAHIANVHGKTLPSYRCGCGKLLKWKTSLKKHKSHCPANGQNAMEISRDEYEAAVSEVNKTKPIKEEIMETEEIIYTTEHEGIEHEVAGHEVTEVTDERLVEEITGKIADELSKSGKVDSADEKMLTETIRNAVLSGEETQVITIPRPSGSEENVYYVIVNPGTEQQL